MCVAAYEFSHVGAEPNARFKDFTKTNYHPYTCTDHGHKQKGRCDERVKGIGTRIRYKESQ